MRCKSIITTQLVDVPIHTSGTSLFVTQRVIVGTQNVMDRQVTLIVDAEEAFALAQHMLEKLPAAFLADDKQFQQLESLVNSIREIKG